MRPDMNKLLCLRGRIRSKDRYGDRPTSSGHFDPDSEDTLSKEKMGRFWRGGGTKEFGEYLNPFRRWLNKQVSRPWDKVYSELCEVARKDNAVQQHAHQHLWSWVERHVLVTEQGVFYERYGKRYKLRNGDLYIHPVTGLLSKYCKKEKPSKAAIRTILRLERTNTYLVQQSGIWYRVDYSRALQSEDFEGELGNPANLVYQRTLQQIMEFVQDPDGHWRSIWKDNPHYLTYVKKQLSTKELKEWKLTNAS